MTRKRKKKGKMKFDQFEKIMRNLEKMPAREFLTAGFSILPVYSGEADAGVDDSVNRATAASIIKQISSEKLLEKAAKKTFMRRMERAARNSHTIPGHYNGPCPAIVIRKAVPVKEPPKNVTIPDILEIDTSEQIEDLATSPRPADGEKGSPARRSAGSGKSAGCAGSREN